MGSFSFDKLGFQLDGQDSYLVSGEFHYFRVPRADWRRRMQLFLEAGGNCLATYVPWVIHEPEEGDIRFNDVDYRDLRGYLELAQELGLKVLLRPGPYQYSELITGGLPNWLLENYPEILAADIEGRQHHIYSVSYMHPMFLEKARTYYRAFAEQVRPFLLENGGPVCMLQLDNELAGVHLWYGGMDYNPDAMGFGRPDGRYPCWLRKKYGTIEKLNAAYGTQFMRFELVQPVAEANPSDVCSCRRLQDYSAFYRSVMAEYLTTLAGWLREDGLNSPICHNSASPTMNHLFVESVESLKNEKFLFSSDHYYSLGQSWAQNNPTPQYALRVLMSCDMLRAMGMPPVAMELPAGSSSDTPPILGSDLLACYMSNLALGLKGVNYYVFTGGPNVPGTGENCAIYDYGAPIHADGRINEPGYNAVKTFGQFMSDHAWMQRAHRVASVQVGFEWNTLRCDKFDYTGLSVGGAQVGRFIEKGLLYTMMCSHYSPEMTLLTAELDINRPLIVPCPSAMSEEAQQAVVDFVERGGRALILPTLPETDLAYQPANHLGKLFEGAQFTRLQGRVGVPIIVEDVGQVFGVTCSTVCKRLPENAHVIATDVTGEKVIGFEIPYGKGKVIWFSGMWEMAYFPQAVMLESLIARLGGQRCIESSNRNLFTSLWMDEQGRRTAFVMNLYSGAQSTEICVHAGGEKDLGRLDLAPMEVRTIDLF